jgi:hypothetical protein
LAEPTKERLTFEDIRLDIEARQRSFIWPDYLAATRRVYDFLWNGDRQAKFIARAGLFLFGMHFLLSGIGFAVVSVSGDPDDTFYPGAFIGALIAFMGLRIFRNAFLFVSKSQPAEDQEEEPPAHDGQ